MQRGFFVPISLCKVRSSARRLRRGAQSQAFRLLSTPTLSKTPSFKSKRRICAPCARAACWDVGAHTDTVARASSHARSRLISREERSALAASRSRASYSRSASLLSRFTRTFALSSSWFLLRDGSTPAVPSPLALPSAHPRPSLAPLPRAAREHWRLPGVGTDMCGGGPRAALGSS